MHCSTQIKFSNSTIFTELHQFLHPLSFTSLNTKSIIQCIPNFQIVIITVYIYFCDKLSYNMHNLNYCKWQCINLMLFVKYMNERFCNAHMYYSCMIGDEINYSLSITSTAILCMIQPRKIFQTKKVKLCTCKMYLNNDVYQYIKRFNDY